VCVYVKSVFDNNSYLSLMMEAGIVSEMEFYSFMMQLIV
jgi:hypothetical protein